MAPPGALATETVSCNNERYVLSLTVRVHIAAPLFSDEFRLKCYCPVFWSKCACEHALLLGPHLSVEDAAQDCEISAPPIQHRNGENFGIKKRGKYLPFRSNFRIHFLSPLVGARTGKFLVKKGGEFCNIFGDKMCMDIRIRRLFGTSS